MKGRGCLLLLVTAAVGLPLLVCMLFLAVAGESGQPAATAAAAAQTGPSGPVAGGKSAAANEATGAQLAAGYGWTGEQDTCLDELWTRESGWSNTAKNTQSGAYGISQALGHLPGEAAATAADLALNREGDNYPVAAANPPPWGDSDPSAQIQWGLDYIKSTYGSPCGAWGHETQDGWY